MIKPDYTASIVNLINTLVAARGARSADYPVLAELEGLGLAERPIVFLVIDGLGDNFLGRFPDSYLGGHRRGRLTSVFPPTTATAVTSLFTGAGPQQHAITGWYTWFREIGAVTTILPFTPRYGGEPLSGSGISPGELIGRPSLLDRIDNPCHVFMPEKLVDSDYSRALSGRADRYGITDFGLMLESMAGLAGSGNDALIVGYWADLDAIAHGYGVESPETEAHFLELDDICRRLLPPLAAAGAAVVVTADHGLVDPPPDQVISLEDHPRLREMLTLPLCGEPRCAWCYVRAERKRDFEAYVTRELSFAGQLRKSRELIEEGWFGLGAPDSRLEQRIGDYALLMKDGYAIRDRLINEKASTMKGVHGGLSADELYVPLIVVADR